MGKIADAVATLMPATAARWVRNRKLYQLELEAQRAYDAVQNNQWRPVMSNQTSGDGAMHLAGARLRQIARQLDENHDLVVGVFDDILNNAIGTGLKVAPRVKDSQGVLLDDFNQAVVELWDDWADSPEVTASLGFEQLERLAVRSYLRDGEVFVLPVRDATFRYRTRVPLALQFLEADFLPFDYDDREANILHGVQADQWDAPAAYYFYRSHPGSPFSRWNQSMDIRRVPAEDVLHLKFSRRLHQRRGVPLIHAVINRLRDVKDYEESERIAAKVAADLTAFIQRNEASAMPTAANDAKNRPFQLSAGSIFSLQPGETVGTVKSDRPNTGLQDFRNAMLRAVAAGTGTRFSSVSKDYNGTYSAQRQELVEGTIAYRQHTTHLCRRFYKPVYRAFLEQALISRQLQVPRTARRETLFRVDFRPPALPWIDPEKEAAAWQTLVENNLESRAEIIRQRGRDPAQVFAEMERESEMDLFASVVEMAEPAIDDEPDADDADRMLH